MIVYCLLCLFGSVMAAEFSKSNQGISDGFLGDCPGSTKPAVIKPKTLETLTISVLAPGNVLKANWTKYTYSRAPKLAKHPEMDFSKKTVVLLPGYLDSINFPTMRSMGTVYKEMGYNVLVVDYFEITTKHYPIAARLIRPVSKHIAEILVSLTNHGLDPKKLELTGISLGAQATGFVAKHYRHLTGQNISSITAMDPAGPCFKHLEIQDRIDASDADFVLQITTNMDGFGLSTPVGHVAVYVNGGEYQAGDLWALPCLVICSHVKSYMIWLSALMNPGTFIAIQCDSVQQARDADCYDRLPKVTNTVDLFTDRSKPGIYYLPTFNRYPYSLGKKGLKRRDNEVTKHLNWLNADEVLKVK
ncbi:phospholipase A1 member A-like [Leguminivora glycinivorella]|uniref:phospholipase A1 member A-like n=1 Tax=Leguminivora glycinivorella TaxID=1035111 RepID=UPI00200FD943|nr:phospholipase A1 member A-like [Leguminivora glycinivorella]